MAQTRFVTPRERWLRREGFSDKDIEERCRPIGGAMWASPFPERRCMYTREWRIMDLIHRQQRVAQNGITWLLRALFRIFVSLPGRVAGAPLFSL